jgi:hypothetical protein
MVPVAPSTNTRLRVATIVSAVDNSENSGVMVFTQKSTTMRDEYGLIFAIFVPNEKII